MDEVTQWDGYPLDRAPGKEFPSVQALRASRCRGLVDSDAFQLVENVPLEADLRSGETTR